MSHLALVPVGTPPEDVLEGLARGLTTTLRITVRREASVPEPAHARDPARGQWSSSEVLKTLLPHAPPAPARLLGVIDRDIFVPVLTFVYGQAQLGGRVGVISLARLRPEFMGLPPDPERLLGRALKEAVHELGHLLGLVHCPDRRCPLSLSVGLDDLEYKGARPCPSCAALLEGSLDLLRPSP